MRIRAAVLLAALVAPALAVAAYAGPALHQEDVTKQVTGHVTELRVDGDVSNVKLVPGDASVVKAHLEWTMQRPDLSVTSARGVLTVKVRCNDRFASGGVTIGLGAFCVDDLSIVVPARANLVVRTAVGDINASRFTGPVNLHGGTIHVSDLTVPRLVLSGTFGVSAHRLRAPAPRVVAESGDVAVDHVSGTSVSVTSSNGSIRASDLTGTTIEVATSFGDVLLDRASASSVRAGSHNGTVQLSDVRAHRTTVTNQSGDVVVRRMSSDRLDVDSGNGRMSLVDVTAGRTTAATSSGDVDVQRLRGARLDVSSDNGYVNLGDVHLRVVAAHSDNGDVVLHDLDAPESVRATSSNGSVTVRVPSGRYYVEARSNNGYVRVTGFTLDRFASRQITAVSTSGDVTVTGV